LPFHARMPAHGPALSLVANLHALPLRAPTYRSIANAKQASTKCWKIISFQMKTDERREFKTGLKTGLMIYGVGILLTVIVHLIFGCDYRHGPPTSALPLFLTLLVGAFRLLLTLLKTVSVRSHQTMGELLVHVVVACLVIAFMIWVKYHY
jgi:hypothetical protein